MKPSQLIALASLSAGLTAAHATTTAYTQSNLFFAALASPLYGPAQTETYEGYATDTKIINGGNPGGGLYTYSGFPFYNSGDPQGTVTGRIDDRDQPGANVGFFSVAGGVKSLGAFFDQTTAPIGEYGDYFYDGESFVVTLPTGTQAIGLFFNISTGSTPFSTDLFINTSVGNAANGLANYDTTQGNNDGTNGGLGSNDLYFVGLISTDTAFTSATIGVTAGAFLGWNVDNLTTATPEPTSICLLTFGVAGLVGYSRRRANR